jgi:hypothetical protein
MFAMATVLRDVIQPAFSPRKKPARKSRLLTIFQAIDGK